MSFERWDPFREMLTLRDAVDRLFQQSVVRPGGMLSALRPEAVPVDVVEREDAYVLRAHIPGVDPGAVQVTVQGDTVTLRHEAQDEQTRQDENWLVRESRSGSFTRTVTLPAAVNPERATATCENGILTLTLPRAEEAKPRRIPIGGMGASGPSSSASGTSSGAGSGSSGSGSAAASGPAANRGTRSDVRQGGSDATAGGDLVTESSQESFPASDPPSWTPEKA